MGIIQAKTERRLIVGTGKRLPKSPLEGGSVVGFCRRRSLGQAEAGEVGTESLPNRIKKAMLRIFVFVLRAEECQHHISVLKTSSSETRLERPE